MKSLIEYIFEKLKLNDNTTFNYDISETVKEIKLLIETVFDKYDEADNYDKILKIIDKWEGDVPYKRLTLLTDPYIMSKYFYGIKKIKNLKYIHFKEIYQGFDKTIENIESLGEVVYVNNDKYRIFKIVQSLNDLVIFFNNDYNIILKKEK